MVLLYYMLPCKSIDYLQHVAMCFLFIFTCCHVCKTSGIMYVRRECIAMTKGYEQRKQANEKYLSTQDRITIRVPKESCMKETIQIHAEKCGESVQAFILRAILAQIERDEQESGAE